MQNAIPSPKGRANNAAQWTRRLASLVILCVPGGAPLISIVRIKIAMNEATIAAPLFTLLASGGTMERTVAHLPVYKAQLEGAFDWMKSNAQFTEPRMEQLVKRFREVVRAKEDAIVNMDFDLA